MLVHHFSYYYSRRCRWMVLRLAGVINPSRTPHLEVPYNWKGTRSMHFPYTQPLSLRATCHTLPSYPNDNPITQFHFPTCPVPFLIIFLHESQVFVSMYSRMLRCYSTSPIENLLGYDHGLKMSNGWLQVMPLPMIIMLRFLFIPSWPPRTMVLIIHVVFLKTFHGPWA